MKTKFSEKLNVRKKDKLFELEIENIIISANVKLKPDNSININSYSIYLSKRSAKLLIQKLQKLIE